MLLWLDMKMLLLQLEGINKKGDSLQRQAKKACGHQSWNGEA